MSKSLSTLLVGSVITEHRHISVMAAPTSAYKDRHFLAVIGDEVGIDLPEMIRLPQAYIVI